MSLISATMTPIRCADWRQAFDGAGGAIRLGDGLAGDLGGMGHARGDLADGIHQILGAAGDRLHGFRGLFRRGRDDLHLTGGPAGDMEQRSGGGLHVGGGSRDRIDDRTHDLLEMIGHPRHFGGAFALGAQPRVLLVLTQALRVDHVGAEDLERATHRADLFLPMRVGNFHPDVSPSASRPMALVSAEMGRVMTRCRARPKTAATTNAARGPKRFVR